MSDRAATRDDPVLARSYSFAVASIELHRELVRRREYVLSKQMLRAGTGTGANVEEALPGKRRRDFAAKTAVASKEARECAHWLRLLKDSSTVPAERVHPLLDQRDELIRMLTSIVKSARESP